MNLLLMMKSAELLSLLAIFVGTLLRLAYIIIVLFPPRPYRTSQNIQIKLCLT